MARSPLVRPRGAHASAPSRGRYPVRHGDPRARPRLPPLHRLGGPVRRPGGPAARARPVGERRHARRHRAGVRRPGCWWSASWRAVDEAVNNAKVGVKFAVALVILVLVMANMRKERIPNGLYFGLLGLTLGNMAIAIFW